jgi:hypothetical protein
MELVLHIDALHAHLLYASILSVPKMVEVWV